MLKRVTPDDTSGAMVRLGDVKTAAPFVSGLEYGAPARGVWNIVHIGMLIPGAHQIYVCAGNCLRGVVLTAAEMNAQSRFSTITIKENNVLDGDMETLLIEGVTDILHRLPSLPPAVLVFTSCIHHFMGCDLALCYRELRKRFPGVDFTDCYMNPIMRKSGLTPDQLMRRQLYSLLKPCAQDDGVNILGNCFPTDETSELVKIIRQTGRPLRDITVCKTYEDYQKMAASTFHIAYNPPARAGGEALSNRLGGTFLYLPLSHTAKTIRRNLQTLCEALGTSYDPSEDEARAEQALLHAKEMLGETEIAIDYTATPAPMSLARCLLEHGFRVTRIYADSIAADDQEDFRWLQEHAPDIALYATVQVKLRVLPRETQTPTLAIGQKAAYFTGTQHFVNIVEGGGMYGFDGLRRLAELMEEAHRTERDARDFIQQKGLGCDSCL